jgi:hypothetical protein
MNSQGSGSDSAQRLPRPRSFVMLVLLYALLIGGYFVLRYGGQWVEGDSAGMTRLIEIMREEGVLQPVQEFYAHGFGYQAVSVFVLTATGLSPQVLQTMVYPILAVIGLGLVSFAFFSQLVRSRQAAVLATLFLLLQPDLLFVTMRGSHEKLDWPLMIVALLLFYRSVDRPLLITVVHVGLFYLAVFALTTVNVFFASSFLVALILGLLLGQVVSVFLHRRLSRDPSGLGRLTYVSLSCGILLFTFMAYLYPVALADLRTMRSIWDQASTMALGFEAKAQPYDYIQVGWVSQPVYLGLTVFTWLLIALSFVAWL